MLIVRFTMKVTILFSSAIFVGVAFSVSPQLGDLKALRDIVNPEQHTSNFRNLMKRSVQADGGNETSEKNYVTGLDVRLQILKWTKYNETPWSSRFRWSIINQTDPNNMTTMIYQHKDNNYTAEDLAVFTRAVDNKWYKIDFPSLSLKKYLSTFPIYEGTDNLKLTPKDFQRVSAYKRNIKDIKDIMHEIDMQQMQADRRKRSIVEKLEFEDGKRKVLGIKIKNYNTDNKNNAVNTVLSRSSSTTDNLHIASIKTQSNKDATKSVNAKIQSFSKGFFCQVQDSVDSNCHRLKSNHFHHRLFA